MGVNRSWVPLSGVPTVRDDSVSTWMATHRPCRPAGVGGWVRETAHGHDMHVHLEEQLRR